MIENAPKKRGRPRLDSITYPPVIIDFKEITTLNSLEIDPRMMRQMRSGIKNIDKFISHEEGIPASSNIMCCGDPGVGKTTVLLDVLSGLSNRGNKCLFISAEMGRRQMFKYTQRFNQFGVIKTIFTNDYLEYNTKDVVEQVINQGWDVILIDSIAEVIDGVRDDNGWDRKMAESWLVDLCVRNNKGENTNNVYTTFLLIQQVTKAGEFAGSNKLKHLTDAMIEMRREKESEGGGTYMEFSKNRNGNTGIKMSYQISPMRIEYGAVNEFEEEEE
jgi:DNA repair protein RadA/Sms